MGLFNKEDKELKKQMEIEALKKLYGIDCLNESDEKIVSKILDDVFVSSVTGISAAFTGTPAEQQRNSLLNILIEQNWLIIKKLDEISKNMK